MQQPLPWTISPWPHNLSQQASGNPGAVQPAGVAWVLQVSLSSIVQNLILKRQVGDQLLQPAVLLLQLLQLPGVLDVQTSVFLSVPVVALLSQTCFLAGRGNALAVALQHLNLPQLRCKRCDQATALKFGRA